MSESNLKKKAISGVLWSGIERFSTQGVTFLVQLVLARLLSPSDYGIIGLLVVFLQIAQVFIDSGFANALIQKQECSQDDYCTVFYYNVLTSLAIYAIFFLAAPLVASFYHNELLTPVMRVISCVLIINALSIVQKTQMTKKVDFRTQTKISLISALISGVIGIILAYYGFGVWALCAQQIINSTCMLIGYFVNIHWLPLFSFSKSSFKNLFGFGSKLLIASLISTIYRNLYALVIGKTYNTTDLGNYSRAEQFAVFPSNNIGFIISRVAFPVLSKIQSNDEQLKNAYRKIIRYSSFIIFPLMIGLLTVARPFVLFFLTSKWEGVIILLQILCLDWMLDHLSLINLNLLYVKGHSDYALRLEIIKKIIAITILAASIPFGIEIMCWGRVIYSVIATIINTYYTKRLINLGFIQQMIDITPFIIAAALMGGVVWLSMMYIPYNSLKLVIGVLTGICFYFAYSFIFFKDIFHEILDIVQKYVKKNPSHNI